MPKHPEGALCGYARNVLKRDKYTCTYCHLDGTKFENWVYLSWDHLLPKGHPARDDEEFIVASCTFCNTLCNRTPPKITEGVLTRRDLVERKFALVNERRAQFRAAFDDLVGQSSTGTGTSDVNQGSHTDKRMPMGERPLSFVIDAALNVGMRRDGGSTT